ncbi:MAG: galactokinase family protein [Candidatus Omnitrophota bacterium]
MAITPQKIDVIISALQNESGRKILFPHYGSDFSLVSRRASLLGKTVSFFRQTYPDKKELYLLRVPARINLMGVHIDHRGGWCNYVPIARETFFCFSPRQEDRISANNIDPHYHDVAFSMGQEIPPEQRGNWLQFLQSASLTRGDWGNYLKAGALKLQDRFADMSLRGIDATIGGDIPPGSGLSSSSSLVVGITMALQQANRLTLSNAELVDICGSGEWYVGTRGGAGDHSAMLLGERNCVAHTGFMPLTCQHYPFPEGYNVILAHCGKEAAKASGARKTFNARIAAYEIAFLLFREQHPAWRERLHYLRDISPEALDAGWEEIYQALKEIPLKASRNQLLKSYPALEEDFDRIFNLYGETEDLPLREVLLFGIAECDRAKRFPQLLREGKIGEAGELMYISHDGDRVSVWKNGISRPYRFDAGDERIDEWAESARRSLDDFRQAAAYRPGGYRCSIPELDRMVDRCRELEGVAGAGLTGAGLGGSILALTKEEYAKKTAEELKALIASWTEGEPLVEICQPAAGAGYIEIP